jgi:hypothetical protein
MVKSDHSSRLRASVGMQKRVSSGHDVEALASIGWRLKKSSDPQEVLAESDRKTRKGEIHACSSTSR